nr:YdcF family protein [uncultured Albidiferax sp.]
MELGEFKPLLTALALPPAAPLLLACVGLLLMQRKKAMGGVLCVGALGGLWLLGCNAVAVWLALNILPQVPALPPATATAALQARQVQAVVVLGGGVQAFAPEFGAAQPTADTATRLRYGVWLARQSQLPLAFAGGVGWANSGTATPSEGAAARAAALQDYGFALRWVDDQSRDTIENATQLHTLLAADGVQRIALVTHAWHMPRAQLAFERAGFTVTPAPTGFTLPQQRSLMEWLPTGHGLQSSREVLREWLALRVGLLVAKPLH